MILDHLITTVVVILSFTTILFFLSVIIKRNDIADIAWGPGILLVGVLNYVLAAEKTTLLTLMLLLYTLWGARLAIRIFLRNIKKGEDFRYKQWRDDWGKWFYIRSYLQVYILQGLLMIIVGYPIIHASTYSTATTSLVVFAGIFLWCLGYFFETVGDWQLDNFIKSKPAEGKILSTGLWKYTRHPNYFGEITMWWAIWLMMSTLPFSILALISPLTISYLILKVSGIPMLEKKFAGNINFEEYKKRTNALIPWLPKKF